MGCGVVPVWGPGVTPRWGRGVVPAWGPWGGLSVGSVGGPIAVRGGRAVSVADAAAALCRRSAWR